jgi:hypothetical protein
MKRTGTAELLLHGGRAPPWLFGRMVELGSGIMDVLVDEYGVDGVLARLSNTFFFQSLSNCLGFDWNSSGTTTVLCGVLSEVFDKGEHGVSVVGGKGARSKQALSQLEGVADKYSLTARTLESLQRSSRLTAKVDNNLVQDSYRLYHHSMFVTEKSGWCVVQQGMDPASKTARRYHWLSSNVEDFVDEPHESIVCDITRENVLDLTSHESGECRKTMLDIVKYDTGSLKRDYSKIKPGQKTLLDWSRPVESYDVPRRMNWDAVERAYELQPENFEDLLLVTGLGGKTLRGLALVSELVYGGEASWRDPVKYCFAFGGKDGVPFPVQRREYDEAVSVLQDAVKQSRLGDYEKLKALKRIGVAGN